jgi:hypothetical protein
VENIRVDVHESLAELCKRCPDCRKRIEEASWPTQDGGTTAMSTCSPTC